MTWTFKLRMKCTAKKFNLGLRATACRVPHELRPSDPRVQTRRKLRNQMDRSNRAAAEDTSLRSDSFYSQEACRLLRTKSNLGKRIESSSWHCDLVRRREFTSSCNIFRSYGKYRKVGLAREESNVFKV